MEDLISRQAVLDLVRGMKRWCVRSEDGKFNNVGLLYDDLMFGLDRLPSVTPKQNWIPVSERLPEVKYDYLGNNISDYVLLWVKKGDYETYKVGYFSPPNRFDAITSDGWFISVCALKDVIAWMPIPKPYKESED